MDNQRVRVDGPSLMIGASAAVVSWMVGLPPLLGAGIGTAAAAVAMIGVAIHRSQAGRSDLAEDSDDVIVRLHPEDDRWIRRGNDAVSSIRHSIVWLPEGPLKDRLADVAGQAQAVLEELGAVAGQLAATRDAARRIEASKLASEVSRLTAMLENTAGPDVEEDVRRSLAAVREQIEVHRRLEAARKVLRVRIESGALGLQGLAARVSEMTALAPRDEFAQQGPRIDELNTQLEALRAGLTDAGALSRRALGEPDKEGGGRDPAHA